MKLIEFPSIKHFKETVSSVAKYCSRSGTKEPIEFVGTIKLHGSNLSYVYDIANPNTNSYFQSRNRVLAPEENFLNFHTITKGEQGIEKVLADSVFGFMNKTYSQHVIEGAQQIIIYGELIGGTIQPSVALAQLPLQFVVFDIAVVRQGEAQFLSYEEIYWFNLFLIEHKLLRFSEDKISCISDYQTWKTSLDVFSNAAMLEFQDFVSNITTEVARECPFAKQKGVQGTGEGVVWRSLNTPENFNNGFGIRFKA